MYSCQPNCVMPLKVVLKNFLNHFETLEARKKLGDDLFEAEFQSLKELTERLKQDPEYACNEGQKEVNRKKNRYKDILPYDLSRVILSEYPGVPGSDYINANLIKGASGSRAYIASQGPLPTTVMDFWRMIWECEVQVIIMACNEKESGKYKCERYWPNEGEKKQYGNITVELVKWKQVCPDFLLRTLRARCGTEERTLCQFHYWSWPDHGVPTSVGPIVDLVRLVRDCQASEALPVLVHCSAGCGRTGTICAIDYVWGLMRVGKLTDAFSLYQIIREMRMQRIAMVQTKEQYVLVHRVVAALFEQQLRIIDSHTYENLDEDGEPLLGSGENIQSNEKIYENLEDLGLENRSEEKENTENDEKCDKEKEVTAGGEESKAASSQELVPELAGAEDASQRQARANRSMSWSPEPNSVATSSSALSSSDARGGSRSSVIADDEDSQSCKDDPVQSKKSLGKKKTGEEHGKASTLSRVRSLSATNICLEGSPGKAEAADSSGKIVGKATVIRRPSIARLKALFEKSDSDDISGGEASRRRPVFRSYSQRVTPRRPSVAQVPDGVETPSASKFKPLLSKRKSLGPSARKAKEFRDQEKSQKQLGASSGTASKKENQTSKAEQSVAVTVTTTKVLTTPMQMVSSSSEAAAKPQNLATSWYGDSSDVWEKNVLYKSFSSSNLASLNSHNSNNAPGSKPLSETSRNSFSSSISSKLGQKCDLPPQLPTKKRTVQTLYAPIPFYAVNTARKSQTLPALASGADGVQPQKGEPRGSSIYDFLPRKDDDAPPRLPPKTKLTKPQLRVVPISALNNTYVNVSDMVLARNELMSRLSDGRYTNVNLEAKENMNRIENVIRQHPRGAIIDLTSRKSFNDRIASGSVSKYEQVWDGKTFVKRDLNSNEVEAGKGTVAGHPVKIEEDSRLVARRDGCESGAAGDDSVSANKEKSATLPSAFRTHANQKELLRQNARQDPLVVSSSDMDTSDIYTTHDERSGTEYDTLFAESSDATETDAPCEKDARWKGFLAHQPGRAQSVPLHMAKNMPGSHGDQQHIIRIPDTEVKRPLPPYETIYPVQPGFIGSSGRAHYFTSNPPPKPPRTYGYWGTKYETGRASNATVGSPKKPSESIYQVPPQPRTTPHMISRPLHRLPPSCDPMTHSTSSVPNFGSVPFAPVYHPRQGVSAIRSPDYENVYACRSALADAQAVTRQQGTRIVKHHSEYRPQIRVPQQEPTEVSKASNSVPAAKLPLQHSFSDASIYEALRGSLSHQQQEQQRLAEIQAQYAVVVKPKKSGLQKSKTVVSESALLGPSGPAAPPRCRRQPQPDSADSSDGAGCKLEKQSVPDDVAQVHVKPSKKGASSGSKNQSKEGSSSGSDGSGFISGTLSKAFGRLNPFYKGNSGTSEEAKKKTPAQPTTTASPKKPDVPKKPSNIAMLRMSKKRPAPQPKVSKAPDFSNRPLSQGPNDSSGSEHWTQV
ncbi:uncharacterized protein LOC119461177 isoform X2 [Dermacentor silvarum]|uniref:uncharacterized protein LOC119461177 isoform X2 n=1 Tax=Dermacentor silvarum TaxID=543639 RepID=UPI0018994751|nr:uncharacterized protein LOC119461177 isoform X2 [Dermacentor silvarum]